MATNNTQTNSRRTPTRPREPSPAEDVTPPPHPPLQYDDSQRFRDYAHAIDFEYDTLSTDDMFANPTPLPQLEIPKIISAAEQLQGQQAQNYPPARGAGLGKTETRSQKRVRFDTPQPGRHVGRGDAVKGNLEVEGETAQKRVRFDMPQADEEKGGVETVRKSSVGESVRPQGQGPSKEETQQTEKPGDEGNSSDDCAWSVDSEVGGGGDGEKAQGVNASSDQDPNVARDLEQPDVEAGESSDQS